MKIRLKLVTILVILSALPAFGMFSKVRTGFSTLAGRIKTGMQSAWERPTVRCGAMATFGGATMYGAQRALQSVEISTPTNFNKATIRYTGTATGDYGQLTAYLSTSTGSREPNGYIERLTANMDCDKKKCTFSLKAKEQWIRPDADEKRKIILLHKNRAQFEKCTVNPELPGCNKLYDSIGGQLPIRFNTFNFNISFDEQEKPKPVTSKYSFPFFFV